MSFNVRKENGKLIFTDFGCWETRNQSTIWCIERANDIYNWDDFPEIKIHTTDYENDNNDYTYSKNDSFHKLVPDFNFKGWIQVGIDDYKEFTNSIHLSGLQPYEINKVGWIGNTNSIRLRLLEIGEHNKDLFDFYGMNWICSDNIKLNSTKYISTPDLAKTYSMVIDVEGAGYSGRLKHLLWSHRPLLLVDRPHKEFFFEYLEEWIHYIPVKRDLSDLVEKTRWCIENYEKAKIIANNAYEFCKEHLTQEACFKQWNKIITEINKN
jgi:hypothetical protein